MRSFEIVSEAEGYSRPIVYLDMDGVLADFFGEVAREHGVEHWKQVRRREMTIVQTARQSGFFRKLPVLPNAQELIRGVLRQAGAYSILSSPLLSNVEESSKEKMQWLQQHLQQHPPQSIIFDHEKHKFATQADGTPNILIDDYGTNIRLWEANGGIGIKYKPEQCQAVLKRLSQALSQRIEPERLDVTENNKIDVSRSGGMYTSRQVLKYVQGIHDEYRLPEPILRHKIWLLKNMPVAWFKTPEYAHQDDPYKRNIPIDWDHVAEITMYDLRNRPVVADSDGWVLDGNHRVTAARARGLETVPTLLPYTK